MIPPFRDVFQSKKEFLKMLREEVLSQHRKIKRVIIAVTTFSDIILRKSEVAFIVIHSFNYCLEVLYVSSDIKEQLKRHLHTAK